LLAGAVASNTTVSAGGTLSGPGVLSGTTYDYGVINGASLNSIYETLYVESGGVASNVMQIKGDTYVSSGGKAVGFVVDYVYLFTSAGGLDIDSTIMNGGH